MSKGERVSLTLRLPKPMHTELSRLANREASSINREVLIAIRDRLAAAKGSAKA